MRFRVALGIDESDVQKIAGAARQCVSMGVMDAEQASIMLVEAVGLEVIPNDGEICDSN